MTSTKTSRKVSCPRCKEIRPSKASFMRHIQAGCCRTPKPHIACEECSPSLAAVGKAVRGALP